PTPEATPPLALLRFRPTERVEHGRQRRTRHEQEEGGTQEQQIVKQRVSVFEFEEWQQHLSCPGARQERRGGGSHCRQEGEEVGERLRVHQLLGLEQAEEQVEKTEEQGREHEQHVLTPLRRQSISQDHSDDHT